MVNLSAAGLSETEAKCYAALLDRKEWKPSDLAKNVSETRTNTYKILDNLVELGLAERFDKDKKLHYRASNPNRLLEIARVRRAEQEQAEKELELGASSLMESYYKIHEQPGVRYFQGPEGLKEIYQEAASAKEEIVFINTLAGMDFYGLEAMHNLRMLTISAGIRRRALTRDGPAATKDYKEKDPLSNLERTWLRHDDYKSPVEWGAFDDKLYIISYGQEALGLIIQSQQIADSFKELFELLERGQKLLPDYDCLPRYAAKTGLPPHKL